MPRAPDLRTLARSLDRVIAERLKRGKSTQVVAGEVVEVDLSAAFLQLCRQRIKDGNAHKPKTPAEKKVEARQREVAESIDRAMARRAKENEAAAGSEVPPAGYDLPEHPTTPREDRHNPT